MKNKNKQLRKELYEIYRDVDFDRSLHGELSLWQFIETALTQAYQQATEEAVERVRQELKRAIVPAPPNRFVNFDDVFEVLTTLTKNE